MGKKGQRNRTYSELERRAAVERAREVGPTVTSRDLGIPVGTLTCWAYLARRGKLAGAQTEAGKEPEGPPRMSASGTKAGSEPTAAALDGSAGSDTEGSDATEPKPTGTTETQGEPSQKRNIARVYTPSQRAEALELAAKVGVTEAARILGMARFSIYDWQRKVKLAAQGKSATSPVTGADADPRDERDRRILAEWRAHPGLGPSQIRNQLRRAGFKVSVHTVRCVMDDNGYVPPKVRRQEVHDRRYEATRPNALWHMDFLQRHIHKQRVSILLLLDDYSRYIVGASLWDADRSQAVLETFEMAITLHGKPEAVMSDGGAAFWAWRGVSQFTRLLEELAVEQLIAKLPQHNGKLEVLNANIQKELFNQERFFDLSEAHRRLLAWVEFYNYKRTSHALGGLLVPADRYHGRAQRVLAELEAGRPADGIGEPLAIAARCLDLLRVSSRGGQVEVLLMGQRLWPNAG